MTTRLWVTSVFGIMLAVTGAFALSVQIASDYRAAEIYQTGTIVVPGVEGGGSYGIAGDDGNNYDVINMPQEFRVYGLRVRFSANYTDMMSYHQWGFMVRLITIERL